MHVTKNVFWDFMIFVSVFTAKDKSHGLHSGKSDRLKINIFSFPYDREVFPYGLCAWCL